MKILTKPFTQKEYNEFVTECNKDGKLRIEIHDGNAYALYDYEIFQEGEVVNLQETEEYKNEQKEIATELRRNEIIEKLAELDQKRIRAICEPDKTNEDGASWLDYYNTQILELRKELQSL